MYNIGRCVWILRFFIVVYLVFGLNNWVFGQNITANVYIEKYKELAIKEMNRTGVPASITLAQGMLESGNGNSRLAVKAKNHFGIKCHNWTGPKIYHDDDRRNECFRKYKSVYESYIDHSDFLIGYNRYNFLFELKPTDYKGWAKGLKKAGYATAKDYDKKLISLIDRYGLHELDLKGEVKEVKHTQENTFTDISHTIKSNNNIKYIVAKQGDTYKSLTEELDMMRWQIAKYNDISQGTVIEPGDYIYLQPKRKKAMVGNKQHIVKEDETMLDISQQYGIKLRELYDKNLMREGTEPEKGDTILLRKRNKDRVKKEKYKEETQQPGQLQFEFE